VRYMKCLLRHESSRTCTTTTTATKTTTVTRPTTTTTAATTTDTTPTPRPPPRPTETDTETETETDTATDTPRARNDECLRYINAFRRTQGVPALTYRVEEEQCANESAEYDAENGFHASFRRRMCSPRAQTECRGTRNVEACINLYEGEGEGGGHYEILRSRSYRSVACGVYNPERFYTQNFYA
jgi:hypothetical protein